MGLFGPASTTDREGRFDRVVVTRADGKMETLTGAQFDKLPFDERIRIILSGKPQFSLNGKPLTMKDAIRTK